MMRNWIVMGAGLLWVALGTGASAGRLWAAPAGAATEACLYAGRVQCV